MLQQDLSSGARQQAAAAYCRLLLKNKLKLQGMLDVVGNGLADADCMVRNILRQACTQLLRVLAPKERARMAMSLFHETDPGNRGHIVQEISSGLLSRADLGSELLVGQATQAFLSAASTWAGAGERVSHGPEALVSAAHLLSLLKPSSKDLKAFKMQLESLSARQPLPPAAVQHLQTFVNNLQDNDKPPPTLPPGRGGPTTGAGAAGVTRGRAVTDTEAAKKHKRVRGDGAREKRAGCAALRQEVLGLLASSATVGSGLQQQRRRAAQLLPLTIPVRTES